MALYAFDGTWDEWDPDKEALDDEDKRDRPFSNIVLMCMNYDGPFFYKTGPGTRLGKIGAGIGGAMGLGASRRLTEQFKSLRNQFKNGDEVIDIIGFSRGAATARMFVDRINNEYDDIENKNGSALTEPPEIRFLGIFDTVASFGFAWTDEEWNFQPRVPKIVRSVRHAMSMDERRETFDLDRIAEPYAPQQDAMEVWFRGGHSDIGGTASLPADGSRKGKEPNRGRGNISLSWMLREARAFGLPFNQDYIDKMAADIDPNAPVMASKDPFDFGFLGIERGDHALEMEDDDLYHRTVNACTLKRTIHGVPLAKVPANVADQNFV